MHKHLKVTSKDRNGIVDKSLAGLILGQRTKDPNDLCIKRNGHPPDGSRIEMNIILQCKRHRGRVFGSVHPRTTCAIKRGKRRNECGSWCKYIPLRFWGLTLRM